jgi:ABC-2 type transport system permease protein
MAQQELPSFMMIPEIEASLVIYFVLFFVTGYFLYSSLFAAIGAAADSETDTQQLALPITAPIMISYFILLQAFQNPDGMLTVVSSMVPFFAPIIMITRLAIGEVPFWQIALTLSLMVLTFYGTMLLSAKIYKVGILSYGSSAKFKDIWRWLRQ